MPNLRSTIGAILLGVIGAAMLYGATNVQVYFYYRKYPKDRIILRCIVPFLWAMDTLHMAFTIHELWHYLIESFGNDQALLPITWSHKVIIVLTVQTLYTWRVWKLMYGCSHSQLASFKIGSGLGSSTLMVRMVDHNSHGWIRLWNHRSLNLVLMIKTYELHSFLDAKKIRWEIIFAFGMSTFNDFALAAGICHLLYLSATTVEETKFMVGILMRYALISGALTSMCSLTGLIIFCAMPNNLIFLGVTFIVTKLYINSYLAMLNARNSIRSRGSIRTTRSSLGIRISTILGGTQNSDESAIGTRAKNHRQQGNQRGEDQRQLGPVREMPPGIGEDAC
ncbi:hypothetical protein F5887DRAFT_1157825 [Amanita rubescens]|nr:hypothetical protein F5887DRAFT_1157825 [Amanita rubescens]